MYIPPSQGQWTPTTAGLSQVGQIPGVLPSAAALYMRGLQQYPGGTSAWFNPLQEQGYGTSLQAASAAIPQSLQNQALAASLQGGYNEAVQGAMRYAANPSDLSGVGASFNPLNPYLMSQIQQANQETARNYAQEIYPRIDLRAVGAGQSGGSRHQIRQGLADQAFIDATSRNTANMLSQGYSEGLGRYVQDRANTLGAMGQYGQLAAGLWGQAPQMYGMMRQANLGVPESLGYLGGLQTRIGAGYQDMSTAALRESERRWNEAQNLPWTNLQRYSSMVYGAPSATSSTSTSSQPGPSPVSGALGGASLGAGIYDWWRNQNASPTPPSGGGTASNPFGLTFDPSAWGVR